MTHLAFSESPPPDQGEAVTWGDHVTDEDYRSAHHTADKDKRP